MSGTYTVAKLNIHLGVVADALTKGFNDGQQAVSGFEAKLGSGLTGTLGGVTGQLVSWGRAAADVVTWMHSLGENVENTTNFADRIGATTQEIAGLHHAAVQGDVGIEAMDKGLAKLERNLGNARAGGEEAQAAFSNLGLDWNELSRLPVSETFGVIADKIKELPTPADKAAAAIKIFGKEAGVMVNLLNEGSAGLESYMNDAGLIEPVTRQQAEAVKMANDAWDKMGEQWQRLLDQAAVVFAPIVEMAAEWATATIKVIGDVVQMVRDAITWFEKFFQVQTAWSDLDQRSAQGAAKSQERNKLKQAADDVDELGKKNDDAAKKAAKALEEMQKKGESVAKSVRKPFEIFEDTLKELAGLVNGGAISWETYGRAVADAEEKLNSATKAKKDFDVKSVNIGAAVRGTSEGARAVADAQRAGQAQLDVAKKQLAEAQRQTKQQEAIEKAIKANRPVNIKEVSFA
jgi:hypothetical protein